LFTKNTDLIKRIMNLILVVWIIIAVVISYNSVINIFFDNYQYTYEEYKIKYCKSTTDEDCKRQHESNDLNTEREKRNQTKVLINSTGNILIIGAFMYFLNKDNKEKTTKKSTK